MMNWAFIAPDALAAAVVVVLLAVSRLSSVPAGL